MAGNPNWPNNQGNGMGNVAGGTTGQASLGKNKKNNNGSADLSGAPKDLASLYLQEWADYKSKFGPLEDLRNTLLDDKADVAERTALLGDVTASYAKLPGQYRRATLGYGAPATQAQLTSFNKKANTQMGLDKVTAYNRGVLSQEDRRYGALSSFSSPSGTLASIGAV